VCQVCARRAVGDFKPLQRGETRCSDAEQRESRSECDPPDSPAGAEHLTATQETLLISGSGACVFMIRKSTDQVPGLEECQMAHRCVTASQGLSCALCLS
jgi:hypothetical protein